MKTRTTLTLALLSLELLQGEPELVNPERKGPRC